VRRKHGAVPPEHDAYGQEIWNCYRGRTNYEIVERDDGVIDVGSAAQYFSDHRKWPPHERAAIRYALGATLDIGCGAGRVALYLQRQGHKVLAIDNSPLAVKVAKLRGVQHARVLAIQDIHALKGTFDTIVMYGNNFGLFGSRAMARRLLAVLHRITSPGATILAAVMDPYRTSDPRHLNYHRRNQQRGRMGGQLRLRIRYRDYCGNWFDYLFVSVPELRTILSKTGWRLARVVPSGGPGYVAILAKR
jgi:SAM-dependent methyltransferase